MYLVEHSPPANMDDVPTTTISEPSPVPAIIPSESQGVHVVEAIYEDGVIKPCVPLDLPAGTPITLQIATRVTATVIPAEESLPAAREHVRRKRLILMPTALRELASTSNRSRLAQRMMAAAGTQDRAWRERLTLVQAALRQLDSASNRLRLGLLMAALALGSATHLFAGDDLLMTQPAAAIVAWGASIALVIAACHRPDRSDAQAVPGPCWSHLETVAVLGLFVAALLIRVLWNDTIPGALSGDEGNAGLTATEFLNGTRNNLFAMGWFSFPSLFFTLPAAAIAAFGRTFGALRIPSALAGALTVVGLYWFARPLFGRLTAALSATMLAALAFHIHFSRIGLNNIWDGVFATFIFGLFWRGWQTNRRWYFSMAGVLIGLSQYFYTGARLIPLVLLGWLALACVTSWHRARQHLPNVVSMFLVALVIVLPLGLFYLKHPDEFGAPMNRVSRLVGYSEGKDWFSVTSQETGKPVLQLVLENYRVAALGFVLVPLRFFYDADAPMLLALPAILFVFGLALAIAHLRDLRYWLILLVLFGAISVAVVTDDNPTAQRYVLAAPMATLLVGLALVTLTRWTASAWPRAGRVLYGAAIAIILVAAGRELQFYFLEYIPTRGYGDLNTQVASSLAQHIERYPPGSQVFLFGAPRMGYSSFATVPYLAPQVEGVDVIDVLTTPPDWTLSGTRVAFVFLPERMGEARLIEQRYPGGNYQWMTNQSITNQDDGRLFLLYELP